MGKPTIEDDVFILQQALPVAARWIALDHGKDRPRGRLASAMAFGIGAVLASENRLGDCATINIQIEQAAMKIKAALLQCRTFDEANNETMFSHMFGMEDAPRIAFH